MMIHNTLNGANDTYQMIHIEERLHLNPNAIAVCWWSANGQEIPFQKCYNLSIPAAMCYQKGSSFQYTNQCPCFLFQTSVSCFKLRLTKILNTRYKINKRKTNNTFWEKLNWVRVWENTNRQPEFGFGPDKGGGLRMFNLLQVL